MDKSDLVQQLTKRIEELEKEQVGQQVADAKVTYALKEAARVEKNELITRAAWRDTSAKIQDAVAELRKHKCGTSCDGVPEKVLALLNPPEVPKPIYTAIFLDDTSKDTLLKAFPPIHPKVFGHHVTLAFKPTADLVRAYEPFLDKVVAFDVIAEALDDKGQAVKVRVPGPLHALWEKQEHHITISCVSSPVYSNELLAKGSKALPLAIRLEGIVRHFTK